MNTVPVELPIPHVHVDRHWQPEPPLSQRAMATLGGVALTGAALAATGVVLSPRHLAIGLVVLAIGLALGIVSLAPLRRALLVSHVRWEPPRQRRARGPVLPSEPRKRVVASTALTEGGARTAITNAQVDALNRPPDPEPEPTSADDLAATLIEVEHRFGDALYRLDLTRDQHQLTRAEVADLRLTGLHASAWLYSQLDKVELVNRIQPSLRAMRSRRAREAERARQRLIDGVDRFENLASQVTGFLAGTVIAAQVHAARNHLALCAGVAPLPQAKINSIDPGETLSTSGRDICWHSVDS